MFNKGSNVDQQQANANGITITLDELIKLQYQSKDITLFNNKRVYTDRIGGHLSGFKGRGIDFEEVRNYQPGDDIRLMDWRVTARTGKPHTKVFHEERERPIFIIVNQNASMYFGTKVAFKSVVAAKLAGLFAWAAVANGDRVGGFIYHGDSLIEFKPKSRKLGILPLLKALTETTKIPPATISTTGFEQTLLKLRHIVKPGSAIIILSDFTDLTPSCEKQLGLLAKQCEVIASFIYDPLEKMPPPANNYTVSDGQQVMNINTYDTYFCREYRALFRQRLETVTQLCSQNAISLIEFKTNDNIINVLKKALWAS